MEARCLADEHFDVAVVAILRTKGHDVATVRQLNENKRGDGWTDKQVLEEAIRLQRVVITDNVPDFRQLAREMHWHEGIVLCSGEEDDADKKADRIDKQLRDAMRERNNVRLTGAVLDARPSEGKPGG